MADETEIVERVARAIRNARLKINLSDNFVSQNEMDQARAALAASGLSEAVERERRLREALCFYAREQNWRSMSMYMCGHSGDTPISLDGGSKARAALKDTSNTEADNAR